MSNKILLELTEKEVTVLETILKQSVLAPAKDILNKIEMACGPQQPVNIGIKDLHYIISRAKGEYQSLPKDLYISRNRVEEDDFKHIALVNSVIMWLNGNSLLKKLAQFDYTDHSCEFEASDE